jgi:hypothetical protein
MKANISFSDEYAVSEVVGAMLLILIAVVVFSVIYMYVFPLLFPPAEVNVQLRGYVTDDGIIVIEHIGGESLTHYRTDVKHVNGTLINRTTYQNREDPWEIGEYNYPLADVYLLTENDTVHVTIYNIDDDGNEQLVFDGILTGKGGGTPPVTPSILPMLISSLRTDTIDEDLICFNYTIDPEINASTYIYNWIVDGSPLAEILSPFDTENNITTKDYSDNANNGTINGATWTNDGVIGGAYYFGGASDEITMNLPSIFNNISNNDFTICLWIKSGNIIDDWREVLEARKDNKNFVKIFQFGTEIHFGTCEDGMKRALRTENISSNVWYHIGAVWDASEKSLSLYLNGTSCTTIGNRNYAFGAHTAFKLGAGTASSRFWLGFMDELQVYDRALSGNQIYQIYLSTKEGDSDERVIVSKETNLGEDWQCIVTPNDGTQDGTPVESNILQIVSYDGGE